MDGNILRDWDSRAGAGPGLPWIKQGIHTTLRPEIGGGTSAQPPGLWPAFSAAPTGCPWEAVISDAFDRQLAGVILGQLPRGQERAAGEKGCQVAQSWGRAGSFPGFQLFLQPGRWSYTLSHRRPSAA